MLGCCIGVSYALKLACKAPSRVLSAVLEQPVGIEPANRAIWPNAFQKWADALLARRPELDPAVVESFGRRMWRQWQDDFVLSVTREEVQACQTPMLVLPGTDLTHPVAMGREIAQLAPHSEVLLPWKEPTDLLPATMRRIRAFLRAHTPPS